MVTIKVLGSLRADVDGAAADLGTPRRRAVLARLVQAGGAVVAVDRLVDDLWHTDPPAKAQAALQVYVSHLRRVLEPGRRPRTPATVLVSAPPGYALRLPVEAVDAWRAERLVRAAIEITAADPGGAHRRLGEALAEWTGPAYAEFTDEPWAAAEAHRLERLRVDALEHRAGAALRLGQAERVLPDLELIVRDDPLRESAVRLLALALYRTGRPADALAVLRRLRHDLAEQLGVDPSPDTRALESDLLRHDLAFPGPGPAGVTAGAGATGPSTHPAAAQPAGRTAAITRLPAAARPVGRTAEIARLAEIAARTGVDGPHVCWITGEAGSGKSTLARMLAGELGAAGWLVAAGRCPEVDGAPPAWAWSEIFRDLRAERPPSAEQARALAPLLEPGAPSDGLFWLHRAAGDYLATLGDMPLLLVLDDVHRADGETLQLARHLTRALEGRPVLVVATYRASEAGDDLSATRAALAAVPSHEFDLAGLDEDAVGALLHRHVDAAAPDLVREVWLRTSGNPLFVAEVGRMLAAEGVAAAAAGIPAGIRHVLRRRLARLPDGARTVLRHAAVIGRDVDVDVLIELDGSGEERVFDGLEAGVLAGLLVEPAPGRVRFAHALVREALYDDTPMLRRGRLHARALAAVEKRRPDDIAGLGRHALAALTAENADQVAAYAAAAARRATEMDAPREAAALWAGALRALDLCPDAADGRRLTVRCGLTSATARAGMVMAAREHRAAAVALAERIGGIEARCAALTCYDAAVTWTVRPDREMDAGLVAALEATIAELGPDQPAMRARLLSTLVFEIEGADHPYADAASTEALALARTLDDPQVLCQALNARYFVVVAPHRRAELAAIGHELLEVSTAAGLTPFIAQAHHVLYQEALGRTDLDAARRHVARAVERATTGQLGLTLAVMGWFEGLSALLDGDLALAERRYGVLATRMEAVGGPNGAAMGVLGRMAVRLAAGRLTDDTVAELRPLHDRLPDDIHDLLARALFDIGDTEAARAVWRPWVPIRLDYFWLLWTAIRGQNAARLQDAAVARDCYAALLPWQGRFAGLENGSVSLGPVDDTLADLAEVLGEPGTAGRHRAAARSLARRVGAVPWI
ncbi:BTAD domain-containing putative transcriptional regulator [Actinoplanes sp. GCM10030250]|uniref:BTAD domain-containing putative transcriptional regulator n=1 Tax=Actinoplanes sp. GCM10030250 TaxID=3273376 RepID=UPI003618D2CE